MSSESRWKIARIILTTLYLMVGWILYTGTLAFSSLIQGLFFCTLVSLMTYSLFIDRHQVERRGLVFPIHWFLLYLVYILFQIYISSFKVLFNVLRGRINPGVVHFRTRLQSDVARVTLANSITLTPGTLTLDLDDDHLVVHWLDAQTYHSKYAGELIKGPLERLLKRIFV